MKPFLWPRLSVLFSVFLLASLSFGAEPALTGDRVATDDGDLVIHPVNHASFVMQWKNQTVYVDPVGGAKRFENLPRPNLILVTDIHQDHLEVETLDSLVRPGTTLVVPQAVAEKLTPPLRGQSAILTNGQSRAFSGIMIEAVPMYNLTPERLKFHTKGRGNGYVVTFGGKRIYISGDTEDIPEMRALKHIDVAFVCMNLPYTMEVEKAASAVREFKPKIVYPYHYRGSDLQKFKDLAASETIEVRLRDWYAP